jgi:two-component sensor histidine kinase
MLHLHASNSDDEVLRTHLKEASGRISAIGRAYERLSRDTDLEQIDLGTYLQEVCADAIGAASHCKLEFEGGKEIRLEPDRAISLALVVNELVTNAAKYAFPHRSDGHIWVRLVRPAADTALLSVRDDGVELPADFDIKKSKGLGMRIVAALSEQLGASITQHSCENGKEFAVLFPCDIVEPIQVE